MPVTRISAWPTSGLKDAVPLDSRPPATMKRKTFPGIDLKRRPKSAGAFAAEDAATARHGGGTALMVLAWCLFGLRDHFYLAIPAPRPGVPRRAAGVLIYARW